MSAAKPTPVHYSGGLTWQARGGVESVRAGTPPCPSMRWRPTFLGDARAEVLTTDEEKVTCKACLKCIERRVGTPGTALDIHLRRFTRDGIASETHKQALKRAGYIDWRHGMWGLTDAGKAEAERRGYL